MYKVNVFFVTKTAKTGNKFKSYFTTSTNDGKSLSVKFTKEVQDLEKPACLTIKPENMRISSKKGYDTLIISGYEKAEDIEDTRVAKYFTEVTGDEVDEAD